MRHHVLLEERRAYHSNTTPNVEDSFLRFNLRTLDELKTKKLLYDFIGFPGKFEKIVTINNAVAVLESGEYRWQKIM